MRREPVFDAETLEKGRMLFSRPARFLLSVADLSQLPVDDKKEVAFIGRSNVGKSTLINALFNNKNMAKTSSTPGRTQHLNFFELDNSLYLVDLPGYGYAKAPTAEAKKWQDMIFVYLKGRTNLQRVFLLVDCRHGLKKIDTDIMSMLDKSAVTYQIVFTKADKISYKELIKVMNEAQVILKNHPAAYPRILAVSAEKQQGVENVRAEIAGLL